jgi:hypothetical protein
VADVPQGLRGSLPLPVKYGEREPKRTRCTIETCSGAMKA